MTKAAVFLWLPRCAGTSILNALQATVGCRKLSTPRLSRKHNQAGIVTFGHLSYKRLVEIRKVAPGFDRRAWKFCFCRDPYDRAVSLFAHWNQTRYSNRMKRLSFLDWVRWLPEKFPDRRPMHRRGHAHRSPQAAWLEGVKIDFVGRVESIEEDVATVIKHLGGTPVKPPHKNAIKHKPYRSYYCQESQEIVLDWYREDFERFNYPREL